MEVTSNALYMYIGGDTIIVLCAKDVHARCPYTASASDGD